MTFTKGTATKTVMVPVRMEPDERDKIDALAAEAGLTRSAFMRRRSLGLPVRSIADAQTINELRRLGGLLKHVHNQTGGEHSQATAAALVEITAAIKRIGK